MYNLLSFLLDMQQGKKLMVSMINNCVIVILLQSGFFAVKIVLLHTSCDIKQLF